MKVRTIIILLVFTLTVNSFGQADGKWSVGVGVTPVFDRAIGTIYINRHITEQWQVGAMPFVQFSSYTSSGMNSNTIMLGLNLNTRFYFSRWTKLLPYAYGYGGYGESHTDIEISTIPPPFSVVPKFYNASVGIGMQVPFGKSGWSLDGNFGYLGYFEIDGYNSPYHTTIYSFGIFKRFSKSKK